MNQKKKDWSRALTDKDKSLLEEIRSGHPEATLEKPADSFDYDYGEYGTTSGSNIDHKQHKQMEAKDDANLRKLIKNKIPQIVCNFYELGDGRLDFLADKTYKAYLKQTKVNLDDFLNQEIWSEREMLAKEFDFEALVLSQFKRYDALDRISLANMLSKSKIKIIGTVRALSGSKYIAQIEGTSGEYAQYEITEAGKDALENSYRAIGESK